MTITFTQLQCYGAFFFLNIIKTYTEATCKKKKVSQLVKKNNYV